MNSIIVCRMFAGKYCEDNIGHEIINIYKTDKGEQYIYINPWGTFDEKYKNANYILLVKGIRKNIWEVIGFAKKPTCVIDVFKKEATTGKSFNDKHKKFAESYLQYGGRPINKILAEQENAVYASFKADKFFNAKNKIYLVNDKKLLNENSHLLKDIKFSSQSLHQFIDDNNESDDYKTLEELFNNSSLWEKNTNSKVNLKTKTDDSIDNIMELIKREDDELTFSNWLAYYLVNNNAFCSKLIKELVGVSIENNYTVDREFSNMDILIKDSKHVVVIENKIKSGINGLDGYYSERHDFKGELKSQLSTYVKKVKNDKDLSKKDASFILLLPDYGSKDKDLEKFKEIKRWKPIRYSQIQAFLKKHKEFDDLPYMREYKKAINKHTKDVRVDFKEIINIRFINKIKNI